jgi:hypothetical protein
MTSKRGDQIAPGDSNVGFTPIPVLAPNELDLPEDVGFP